MKVCLLLVCFGLLAVVRAETECVCTRELNRVCGSDGVTYNNPCLATCQGASIEKEGPCEGHHEENHEGERQEGGHNVDECYGEEIMITIPDVSADTECVCTTELNRVCGSDGVTYDNPCLATCQGASVEKEEPCEGHHQEHHEGEQQEGGHNVDEYDDEELDGERHYLEVDLEGENRNNGDDHYKEGDDHHEEERQEEEHHEE